MDFAPPAAKADDSWFRKNESRVPGSRRALQELFAPAGLRLDGDATWDPKVHDERFCSRVLAQSSLGLGESYVDGWWDCEELETFFYRLLSSGVAQKVHVWRDLPRIALAWLSNRGRRSRAFEIGERHYDLGNDLYETMLDRRMTYSCGYWARARTLDEAQEAKLDLICRKARLKPGMRVLDIGCGWGGFATFAAERYGVSVVGITVSKEQIELGRRRTAGLPVQLLLQDYRDLAGTFDAIVSVGMFEHVGRRNYRTFFDVGRRCLAPGGLFVLHTIGTRLSVLSCDPWIEKYIFPNSLVPSMAQIAAALENRFVIEDWQNIGPHYEPTLMAWFANFRAGWSRLEERYGKRFFRMWSYYLRTCAGSFRARYNDVWQIVLSREGLRGGYEAVR
ncbi:MAG TPA: cyclopropane fatty acyl phospholipid synthase [Thermoanaerobaculia bacterium]|nr:cyclopropane fatty acyl phospholipid synthase [Thermoanaerobaculia bacterium]